MLFMTYLDRGPLIKRVYVGRSREGQGDFGQGTQAVKIIETDGEEGFDRES